MSQLLQEPEQAPGFSYIFVAADPQTLCTKHLLWAAGSSGVEGVSTNLGYFSRKEQLPASFLVREEKSPLCWKKWTCTNKLTQLLFPYPSKGINWLVFILSRCLFLVWFLVMNLKTRTHLHVVSNKYQRWLQGQKRRNGEGRKNTATTGRRETIEPLDDHRTKTH